MAQLALGAGVAAPGAAECVRGHREGRPRGGTGERVRFCGALLLELVLALVLRCCRARHTLNCVVDPCVGSGAQGRRPNCAGHAVRVGAGVSGG